MWSVRPSQSHDIWVEMKRPIPFLVTFFPRQFPGNAEHCLVPIFVRPGPHQNRASQKKVVMPLLEIEPEPQPGQTSAVNTVPQRQWRLVETRLSMNTWSCRFLVCVGHFQCLFIDVEYAVAWRHDFCFWLEKYWIQLPMLFTQYGTWGSSTPSGGSGSYA